MWDKSRIRWIIWKKIKLTYTPDFDYNFHVNLDWAGGNCQRIVS